MEKIPDDITALYRGALSVNQVYGLTGIDPRTLKRAIQNGQLLALRPPGTDRWRIPQSALTTWLTAGINSQEVK